MPTQRNGRSLRSNSEHKSFPMTKLPIELAMQMLLHQETQFSENSSEQLLTTLSTYAKKNSSFLIHCTMRFGHYSSTRTTKHDYLLPIDCLLFQSSDQN